MTKSVEIPVANKATRIGPGEYHYRGFKIWRHGYLEGYGVAWEAIDLKTGKSEAHGRTKRQMMDNIDSLLEWEKVNARRFRG